jgi:formate dehydrogenase alpha subunit
MTNSLRDIASADCFLVIGSNTAENHPIVALKVKEAVRRGAKLIVADPRRTELADWAHVWLRHRPGTDLALVNGLLHVVVKENLVDEEFVASRTEGFEEVRQAVEDYPPAKVAEITGVPAEDIVRAARLYAAGPRSAILYCMGVTQHVTGTANVLALANLAMACGHIGREGSGVNPLRGQNNVQGACDMGGLPNVLPGYQPVADPEVRKKFAQAWGVAELPAEPGMTLTEMTAAAREGRLKSLYIMGENPVISDADAAHVEEALKKLEFLVVQDIFLTETARLADVVLPGAAFAEKEGTFTNTERRVQLLHRAVRPPGEARPDWVILAELLRRLGLPAEYSSPREIMAEITSVTPQYAGITYERLEEKGLQWPVPSADHPGTPILHRDKFTRGLGKFHVVHYSPPAEPPDEEYPFLFTTGRLLFHYHAVLTRRSRGLEEACPEPGAEIHPDDAAALGVADGDFVELVSRRGRVRVKAKVTDRVPRGVVFMSFHFREAVANLLTVSALDPVSKIPELKTCAVRIEKRVG